MNAPTYASVLVRSSSLSGYPDCPRRAATKLFPREIEAAGYTLRSLPSNVGAAVGTGVHAAAAMILKEKAANGNLPPLNVATDAAVEELRNAVNQGITWDKETPVLNEAELQVARMVQVYRHQVAPMVDPLIVEERLEAQVSPAIVLTGQSDVIAREPGRVRDLKGGKVMGMHAPQIGSYSLLARSNAIDVTDAVVDWIPRVPLKKPQPDAVTYRYDVSIAETAAVNVLRHIESDLATFRSGDMERHLLPGDPWAFVANPSSKLCSAKWCPAHGTDFCREHAAVEE
ncbi:hypothetical protein D3877_11810 [Azospirillum cavernae]|uniref:PD-(D/E)XK endonuclease-like domain-containing protein n=1 Tax=Azospirillum cavernae TaxID=2320860 RepID=A0A418VUU3_9PROT|nr:hypothetical protein [Azospirillum cavernae]RJF80915.1 hypothetical protein D3877_11810 [Azospirillum cavernae]